MRQHHTPTPSPSTWRLTPRVAGLRASAIRELLAYGDAARVLPLAGGLPANDGFPVELLRDGCARILCDQPARALQYAESEGCAALRERIAERLLVRGMKVDPAAIIVTHGAQQGLDLLAKVLVDSGTKVLTEAPTYVGALQALTLFGAENVTLDEPTPAALANAMHSGSRPGFAYLMPSYRNPTGSIWSATERDQFTAAAAGADLPLVEDDAYGELWYDAPPPPPLASYWPQGVAYLGSLSKVLAPGLRLGYLVLPAQLARAVTLAKQASDLHTSAFTQLLAAEVLGDPRFEAHLAARRGVYRERRDALAAALHRHLPQGCQFATPAGGMFIWLSLPMGCSALAVARRALTSGVAVLAGDHCYPERNSGTCDAAARPSHLRLCFTTLPAAELARAAELLGNAITTELEVPQ